MGKIIFLDVDGTLINYKQKLPESAKTAIDKARKNGHKVYLCTGCSLKEIEVHHWDLEYDGMIGGNGCYIETDGQVIKHDTLSLEDCTHFVNWCKDRKLAFRLECNSGIYLSDDYLEKSLLARIRYERGKDATIQPSDKATLREGWLEGENLYRDDVNKTAFVLNSYQDYLDAAKEFAGLKVGTWGGVGENALYGDVGVANITKASAIHELLTYLKADKNDTLGFGDAKSDIPMFECCQIAVAMGNSGPEAKEAADYITDDVDNDGLYNAFQHFQLF